MLPRIRLAPDGPEVSRFAYGTWRLLRDPEGATPARIRAKIDACLSLGITTFDLAEVYGGYACEAAFGAALADGPAVRDRIELVSKCGIQSLAPSRPAHRLPHYDLSEANIVRAAEQSLVNLRTDHLDVLLLHRPSPLMDPDEVASALIRLRDAGKIRHAGVSNFTPSQLDLIQSRLPFSLVTNQVEVSLLHTEPLHDGTLDHLLARRLRPMCWSPTAGGRLFTSDDPVATRVRAALQDLAPRYGATAEQLAYAWLLHHPACMQIVLGTNRIDRVAAAASAAGLRLDLQDWFVLLKAARGADVP